MNEVDRFMSKVSPEPNSGCWLWTGGRHGGRGNQDYGSFWSGNRSTYAHRRALELLKGEDVKGKLVTHSCDTSSCVNPDHLVIGTYTSNLQEAWDRGRQPKRSAWNKGQRR